MTDLPVWYCQNPGCTSRLHGQPRVVLVGQLGPGSVVPRRCPVCKSYTTISVIDGGTLLQVGADSPTVSISPNGEDSLAMRRR